MSRTTGYLMQDLPNTDGVIGIPASLAMVVQSGAAPVRISKGIIVLNIPAGFSGPLALDVSNVLFRYGMQDDAQQQFGQGALHGGIQGAQARATLPSSMGNQPIFTTPYGQTGRPPFTTMQNLVPPTSRPKGIAINLLALAYQVLDAPLVSATIGMTKTLFNDGMAPQVIDIIPAAQYGLDLSVTAQPQTTIIPNPVQNQMLTEPNAQYIIELDLETDTGTFNYFGLKLGVAFNYN